MSSKKVEKATLKALRHIRDKGEFTPCSGICENIRAYINRHVALSEKDWAKVKETQTLLFISWEKFSGNTEYPIPHPEYLSPSEGYNHCRTEHMWNREHPYGALRWEMVHHMIKKLEEKYP